MHVHLVSDAIQPSILFWPLLLLPSVFPSIRVFSNELALCIRWPKYWVSASVSVLPMNIHGWFPLGLTGLISFLSKGLSRVFSSTTVRKHQFFGAQPSLWSNSHIHIWLLEKPQVWLYGHLLAKWCLCFLIGLLNDRIRVSHCKSLCYCSSPKCHVLSQILMHLSLKYGLTWLRHLST